MEDIAQASGSIAAGSDQTASATRDLSSLAGDLTIALNRFHL
jgi:methyl-accepting chemotaxis protein